MASIERETAAEEASSSTDPAASEDRTKGTPSFMKHLISLLTTLSLLVGTANADPVTASTIATLLASSASVDTAVPSVASTPDGQTIVAWVEAVGFTRTLRVAFLDRTGTLVSGPSTVNLGTLNPIEIDAAATPNGFMVCFGADTTTTVGLRDIHYRTFDLLGTETGSGQANTLTALDESRPKCDGNFAGDYCITWRRTAAFGVAPSSGIFARRFNSTGGAIDATEVRVDDPLVGFFANQDGPSVGFWNSGRLVFTWTDGTNGTPASTTNSPDGHGQGVLARFFDASMTPLTSAIVVTATTANDQFEPLVAVDALDGCVIGWCGDTTPTLVDAYIRRFDNAGNALDANDQNLTLSNFSSDQFLMGLGVAANGEIVASWHDQTATPGQPGPRVGWARLDQNANQYGSGLFETGGPASASHYFPRIGVDQFGNFVGAWQIFTPGSPVEIRMRRYQRNMLAVTTTTPTVGGFLSVFIDSPSDANAPYLIGVSGGPGPFYFGSRTVGLTQDALLDYVTTGGGGIAGPIFYNFAGMLDATGSTSLPGVLIPNYPPLSGQSVYFVFATGNGPAAAGGVNTISESLQVTIL